jgi:hypothetical protein
MSVKLTRAEREELSELLICADLESAYDAFYLMCTLDRMTDWDEVEADGLYRVRSASYVHTGFEAGAL